MVPMMRPPLRKRNGRPDVAPAVGGVYDFVDPALLHGSLSYARTTAAEAPDFILALNAWYSSSLAGPRIWYGNRNAGRVIRPPSPWSVISSTAFLSTSA